MEVQEQRSVKTVQRQRLLSTVWMLKCCLRQKNPAECRPTASARIAPIAMDDERVEEGSRVELAGLVRDVGLNGRKGICMGRAPDGERWLIALPGGKRVNVKMSNIKPAGDLDTEICSERRHECCSIERS